MIEEFNDLTNIMNFPDGKNIPDLKFQQNKHPLKRPKQKFISSIPDTFQIPVQDALSTVLFVPSEDVNL